MKTNYAPVFHCARPFTKELDQKIKTKNVKLSKGFIMPR